LETSELMGLKNTFAFAACLASLSLAAAPAFASNDPAMDAAVNQVEHEWARIKYKVSDPKAQHRQIQTLAKDASTLASRFPGRAEPLIWNGIAKSEEAAMSSGFSALSGAKAARQLFETAYRLDPRALEAGAPTSLGVLYYRVPGFPIGFGDKAKAQKYLSEAVSLSPDSMDANYFYGDFLASQGQYAAAARALQRALAAPPHPDRPVWDAGRRSEIRVLLARVNGKPRSHS
jgi:tetratricopeptide (TPR) repeat protein